MTMQPRLVTSASGGLLPSVAVRMVDGVTHLGGPPTAPPVLIILARTPETRHQALE
jgi:hypothetical protein